MHLFIYIVSSRNTFLGYPKIFLFLNFLFSAIYIISRVFFLSFLPVFYIISSLRKLFLFFILFICVEKWVREFIFGIYIQQKILIHNLCASQT